ncbi:MAG: MotA/TolQ/ExbB proton channel [Planctomycetaceae bacterium]|nr:MAG: MotA/TolQ/ExbB proton channel [Planctomycetaceae bacterium]
MEFTAILDFLSNMVYPLQGLSAVFGTFLVVLIFRRIAQKRFRTQAAAEAFLNDVRELLSQRQFEQVAALCDSPPYWSKAVPQLILVALAHRERPIAKLRELLAERFTVDVLSDIEHRLAWVNTLIKTAPMLGLQGTVLGMISAFAKIAGRQRSGVDPSMLAQDISFALWTTAIGLAIAIPLVIAGGAIHVRMGKLQDAVQQQLAEFLEALEAAQGGRTRRG